MTQRAAVWFLLLIVPAGALGAPALTGRLQEALHRSAPGDLVPVWVFFTDKGVSPDAPLPPALSLVSARALRRRATALPADRLVDQSDLPVCRTYIDAVTPLVTRIRQVSRWLNGVSAEVTGDQLARIEALPCVRTVDLVQRYRRVPETEVSPPRAARQAARQPAGAGSLDYGESLPQVSLENIPAVNATGNSAQGVIIGMFDNGVRLLTHEAFDFLRPRIIAQHDYVDHKESVIPNNLVSAGFGAHGVFTLSTIAGYKPGTLIGPAYGASFILARTENDSSETPIEEDNWAAAIEWAESLGVQVTSTSLGYFDFDPGWTSLTWQDMNGRTAVISIAALMAARKGIIVVNSAGNDAQLRSGMPNTLIAPADADSILTAGAVTPFGVRAGFSSYGPTSDGRIKPDVMAVGTSIQAADPSSTSAYTEGSEQGTSFSCPLTAGVAALVLAAHPEASPQAIVAAIRSTAHQAQAQTTRPDNYYGWGIIDAVAAINALGPVIPVQTVTNYQLLQNFPNPFNPGTTVGFIVPEQAEVTIEIFDVLGRRVRTLLHDEFAASGSAPYTQPWDGTDDTGRLAASGVYLCRMQARGVSGMTTTQIVKMALVR